MLSNVSCGSSEGGVGWLELIIVGRVMSKVVSVVDIVLYYVDGRYDNEMVQYNGIVVVMKKFKLLGLVLGLDVDVDVLDDVSEVEGKNVFVQFVSNVIDLSMCLILIDLN